MSKTKRRKDTLDPRLMETPPGDILDPAIWNRMKHMVEFEALHPDWGCVHYQMHRQGQLTNEQREAGDIYMRIWHLHRRLTLTANPDETLLPELKEQLETKIRRAKKRFGDAVKLLGLSRKYIDWVVIYNNQPESEKHRIMVRDGLQLISNFFGRGRNKK